MMHGMGLPGNWARRRNVYEYVSSAASFQIQAIEQQFKNILLCMHTYWKGLLRTFTDVVIFLDMTLA
jgi:hypothetical protein